MRRWWRSFLVSGSTGIYMFVYGIVYYSTKLRIESATSTILYFGYTFIMSMLVFLMTVRFLWIHDVSGHDWVHGVFHLCEENLWIHQD